MNALIIGGTGTISRWVVSLAVQSGWDVSVLNRGNRPLPKGARALRADMRDEAAVSALLQDERFDVVADFIAFTPEDIRLSGVIWRCFRAGAGSISSSARPRPTKSRR